MPWAAESPPNIFCGPEKIAPPHCALKFHTIGSCPPFNLTSYHPCSRQAGLLSVLQTHFVFGSLFLLFLLLGNLFLRVLAWLVRHSGLTSNVISSLATQSKLASHSLAIILCCFLFFTELTFIPILFVCLHLVPCLLSVSRIGKRMWVKSSPPVFLDKV